MIEDFVSDANQRMDKSVEATHEHFNSVRTGRAAPALLDRIQVDYYGTPTPLKNMATISAPEPRLLSIQPFDPSSLARGREGDHGVGSRPDAVERRQGDQAADSAAHRGAAQGAREARPLRWRRKGASPCETCVVTRSSISRCWSRTETSATTTSVRPRARVQKVTDDHVAKIDELLKRKEAEIMEV